MTRYAAIALFLSFSLTSIATAQSPSVSHGYAFAGFGEETGYSSYLHVGIGGDWVVRKGFGIAGEVGGVTNRRQGAPSVALLSGNGSYHFPVGSSTVDPFVTAGITLVTTGGGSAALWNWGGGANWWMRPRFGVRFEFRDHVWPSAERHLVEFRIGVSFR